jgi:hypothetical protein
MPNGAEAHPYCDVCRKVGHFTKDCTKHLKDSANGMRLLLEALHEAGRAVESRTRRFKEAASAIKDSLFKTKE